MQQLAQGPSQPGFPTYGLVSLWDMLSLNADKFVAAVDALATLSQFLHLQAQKTPNAEFKVEKSDREHAKYLLGRLTDLELPVSAKSCSLLVDAMQPQFAPLTVLNGRIRDLHERMKDELDGRLFLHFPSSKKRYFTLENLLFGEDVAGKFPSAAFDLDEAGKCYALARYTASAFHLMRVMEIGIRAAARCLGVPDPVKPAERNWGAVLRAMDTAIKAKNGRWARAAADADFFDETYLALDRVRSVWRNSTMHVESKYTEEEAIDIMDAVRAFMRKLAASMDETGTPTA